MFDLFRVKPYKSRLTPEEYERYKSELGREIERKLAFDIGVPDIRFDDKYRHIVLMNFDGCVTGGDTIVVPDGVTLVYVTKESCEKYLDSSVLYSLILSDTVQYVDELPFNNMNVFDTNRLEAFRMNSIRLSAAFGCINTVILRDTLRQEKCVGHYSVENLFYKFEKPYKIKGNQVFMIDSDGARTTNVFIDDKCLDVSLGKRPVHLYLCDGACKEPIRHKNKAVGVKSWNSNMEDELNKLLEEG